MKYIKTISVLSIITLGASQVSYGVPMSPQIRRLMAEKEEKMKALEQCDGKRKGWMIAGISTIGLTAVGVGVNIAQASKSNKLTNDIDAARSELQTQENKLSNINSQISQIERERRRAEEEHNRSNGGDASGNTQGKSVQIPSIGEHPRIGDKCQLGEGVWTNDPNGTQTCIDSTGKALTPCKCVTDGGNKLLLVTGGVIGEACPKNWEDLRSNNQSGKYEIVSKSNMFCKLSADDIGWTIPCECSDGDSKTSGQSTSKSGTLELLNARKGLLSDSASNLRDTSMGPVTLISSGGNCTTYCKNFLVIEDGHMRQYGELDNNCANECRNRQQQLCDELYLNKSCIAANGKTGIITETRPASSQETDCENYCELKEIISTDWTGGATAVVDGHNWDLLAGNTEPVNDYGMSKETFCAQFDGSTVIQKTISRNANDADAEIKIGAGSRYWCRQLKGSWTYQIGQDDVRWKCVISYNACVQGNKKTSGIVPTSSVETNAMLDEYNRDMNKLNSVAETPGGFNLNLSSSGTTKRSEQSTIEKLEAEAASITKCETSGGWVGPFGGCNCRHAKGLKQTNDKKSCECEKSGYTYDKDKGKCVAPNFENVLEFMDELEINSKERFL